MQRSVMRHLLTSQTLFKHGKIYSNLQIFIGLRSEQSTDELQDVLITQLLRLK